MPSMSASSSATSTGGTQSFGGWTQGDIAVSYDSGAAATSGAGGVLSALSPTAVLIAGAILVGALLWKHSR